jgi:hypothetical protein
VEFLLIAISALVIGVLTLLHTLHVRTTERMDRERQSRLSTQSARGPESDGIDDKASGSVRTFDRLPNKFIAIPSNHH